MAGLLFRLEVANLMGATRKTCTSKLCQFVVPSTKKKVVPDKLSSFLIKNENYAKLVTSDSKEDARLKLKRKLEYLPMSDSGKNLVSDKKKMRNKFYEAVKEIAPNSCFVQLVEGKVQNAPYENENLTINARTLSLSEHAELLKKEPNFSEESYLNSIKLSKNQIDSIYQNTITQSKSKFWFEQRKGRITASKFKKIYTRMNTLKNENSTEDPTPLISEIMGKDEKKSTWQMNFGLSAERHAVKRYKQIMRLKHKEIKFTDPGMTVSETDPFISCTPDLEVFCPCCKEGICEIKCPPSIPSNRAPSVKTYNKHLEIRDGRARLKKTSEYYYQIQGQMALTKRTYGDFFVFNIANRSFHLERIKFDLNFWQDKLSNLKLFWNTYILPQLLLVSVPGKTFNSTVADVDDHEKKSKLVEKILQQESLDIEIV